MANDQQRPDTGPAPEEQLAEARRRFRHFATAAEAALHPGSAAAVPLLDALALLTEALGTAVTRVDDEAAGVVETLYLDLNRTVREAGAATGARGGTTPAAPGRPGAAGGAQEALRQAQEAAEAARDAENATVRARHAAARAWEARTVEVSAARAAEEEAHAAKEEARAAKEEARAAREEARAAREEARAAREETRTASEEARAAREEARAAEQEARASEDRARASEREARSAQAARAQAEADRQQAETEAERHRQEQQQAEQLAQEARDREAEARRRADEATQAAKAANDQAADAERAADKARADCAAAQQRAQQATEEADTAHRRTQEAEAEAAGAQQASEEARRVEFHSRLRHSLDEVWRRYRNPAYAFGIENPPEEQDTGALWRRSHVALLRLTEPDRLREAEALAGLARRYGLDPGQAVPVEPEPDTADPDGRVRPVVAVPALPGYGVEELRLSTDVPHWDELADHEREEVAALLEPARAAKADDRSGDRLAALLSAPREGDLLLTMLLRIWQADRLLALDAGLGRRPDARKRRWIPWEREDFRRQSTGLLTLLASVYPEPVEGWQWARQEDAELAVGWLHALDAVLSFHHQVPALRGSWWWNWRMSLAQELVYPAGWAGRKAVVDPAELTRLFTGRQADDYFEQPDVCDRVDPPIQWISSPPLVAADGTATPQCLRKGRVVRGVGRG